MQRLIVRSIGLLFSAAALLPPCLTAQSDPRLVAAVRNAQEGQSDSARAAVRQLLAQTPTTDTLYPQILYTAAIIANNAADMQQQLQQVMVEFPTSGWVDDALLRLAQLDYANRQLESATRELERIAIDFPTTPLLAQAAYWAGRTYFDLKKNAEACRWLANGIAHAGEDIEIQTQLNYLYQRCDFPPTSDTSVARADSSPRPDSVTKKSTSIPITPPAAPSKSATVATRFRVQIAAVGTAGAAQAAVQKAQALGYRAVTVQEGGMYKVRVGEFPTRAEAQQASAVLKARLGGSPFVVSDR